MDRIDVNIENGFLTAGKKYVLTFEASLFTGMFATLLNALKGLIGIAIEFTQGKNVEIQSIQQIGDSDFIEMEILVLQNIAPVLLVVGGILAVLGVFGTFLVLTKVEELTDTGVLGDLGINIGLVVVLAGLIFILTKGKKLLNVK